MSKIVAVLSFDPNAKVKKASGRVELIASRKLVIKSKMTTIPSLIKYLFANKKRFTDGVEPCDALEILSNKRIDPAKACSALVKAGEVSAERVLTAIQFKTTRGNRKAYDSISAHVNSRVGTDFDYLLLTQSDIDKDEELRVAIEDLEA